MNSRRLKKNGWTMWHAVSAAVMLISALAVTWRGWAQIIELGLSRAVAGHVFLVPVVATFLVWVRRRRMLLCRPSGSLPGLVMAGVGAMAFVYGDKRVHPWLFHGGAVLLPTGCVVAILGRQVFRAYLPAFVVLLALIPPPIAWAEKFAQPLQVATGRLTCWLYDLVGSTAQLNGQQLRIGDASVRLDDVAAGLPMALSLALVSYGFVFGTPLRMSVRLAILLISPLSAIVCSAVAVAGTFWLYEGLSQERADLWLRVGEWVMLLVAFMLLVAAVRMLTWASVPVRHYTLAYDQ
ncbi:MAG: exosortase/archaeosortase family protein [Planctomycetota bacterium]